jgi:hypothetical protein
MVKGMSPGNATITATTTNGKVSNVASITVKTTTDPVVYLAGPVGLFIDGIRDTTFDDDNVPMEVFVDNQGNVHVVGQYWNEAAGLYDAGYWKNDVLTPLAHIHGDDELQAVAYGLFVTPNGDVHIVGEEIFEEEYTPDGYTRAARWWKNGQVQTLQGVDDIGTGDVWTSARAIRVYGDDVYVVGYYYGANRQPTVWKNGTRYTNTTNNDYYMTDVCMNTDTSQLTMIGNNGSSTYRVWRATSTAPNTLTTVSLTGNNAGTVNHVFAEGANVYYAGYNGTSGAYYWTNGTRNTVLPSPTKPGFTASNNVRASDMHVLDGHIYINGWRYYTAPSYFFQPVLWVDGVIVTPDSLAEVNMLVPGETSSFYDFPSIFVK